uniref:Uncharacterized protein n=1 Tax=Eutreptiella gymnastica TaxID=73025 RepID=A0A6U8H220_9EUGL|mmetsp:Transcript_52656/g.93980  ORF Transcript_52656/g.93980 Transcript_52656/m.93980 type:complete len:103 (+) Transcript_52656:323-631(+)
MYSGMRKGEGYGQHGEDNQGQDAPDAREQHNAGEWAEGMDWEWGGVQGSTHSVCIAVRGSEWLVSSQRHWLWATTSQPEGGATGYASQGARGRSSLSKVLGA